MTETDDITHEIPEDLSWEQYQELALETAVFPEERAMEYTIVGFWGECGSVGNYLSKIIRDDEERNVEDALTQAGDALWYGVVHLHYNEMADGMPHVGPIKHGMGPARYNSLSGGHDVPRDCGWVDAALDLAMSSSVPSRRMFLGRNYSGNHPKVDEMSKMASWTIESIYSVCLVIDTLGGSPREVAIDNLMKLRDRAERGAIKGTGEDR